MTEPLNPLSFSERFEKYQQQRLGTTITNEIFDGYDIPDYMQDGLLFYLNKGIEPGSFLLAVLSNNLAEACARADNVNRHYLFNYVNFLYNAVPSPCWHSRENVERWIENGGLEGKPKAPITEDA